PAARPAARQPAPPSRPAAAPARNGQPPAPVLPPAPTPPPVFVKGLEPRRPTGALRYSAPSVDGSQGPVTSYSDGGVPGAPARAGGAPAGSKTPARNALCPCGSGRKYKRCHGDPARRSA
ncbi:MAG: SEC-C domain-containing protein, partial [Frankia sp.]|nr:SEC-C domain-containing protein [Frankia sp.]